MAITKVQSGGINLTDDFTFTGSVSGQNYPAFEAYLDGGNQSVAHQVNTKILVNTENFDIGGYYDNATNYRYTPLVAGKYFFYAYQLVDTTTSNMKQTFVQFYKNGSLYTDANINFDNNNGEGGTTNLTKIIDMNGSTDYVELYSYGVTVDNGNFNVVGANQRTTFGAYRIGA